MDSVRHVTHIEHVRRDYTQDEILQKGQAIAKMLQDASRLEGEKKLAADSFKNQIEKVENDISELGKQIRLGYETVPMPCDVVLNRPTPGMKSYVSQKTLEGGSAHSLKTSTTAAITGNRPKSRAITSGRNHAGSRY